MEPETGPAFELAGSYRQRPAVAHPAGWAAALVTVVALVVAGVVLASRSGSHAPAVDPVATTAAALAACPATGHTDEFGIRSIEAAEVARLPDTYTFLRVGADGCTPARFNPCAPVHFVQNVAAAPPFVADNVREAFRRLSAATGIQFVDDGTTDETTRASAYVPERYGPRWAPILIVWEHFPVDQTTGRSQILGQTTIARQGDVTVSGRLRFNVDAYSNETSLAPFQDGFGPPLGSGTGPILRENVTWGRIVLHELAHVVGLGHTRDTASLMYPDAALQTGRPADFAPPDGEGLRYLGREAGCLTTPPAGPTAD
ncbi:MAG: M10 family metallopeptidase domain-containing protein [Actinomycetota bacterium]|nr:M10 family metallopeptidase domain-containing protein [Actinomycetota bacterium]